MAQRILGRTLQSEPLAGRYFFGDIAGEWPWWKACGNSESCLVGGVPAAKKSRDQATDQQNSSGGAD